MKNKEELLAELREGLNEGTISEEDLKTFVTSPKPQAAVTPAPQPASTAADNDNSDRLSVVDVMFYIA